MRGDVAIPLGTLAAFLFVLGRVAGVLVAVPLPGVRKGPEMSRLVLALVLTVALFPHWPKLEAIPDAGLLALALVAEAALGVTIGVVVAFLQESFLVAAQAIGLQAGYSYATMVNPDSEDESSVLLVLTELMAGLLFFAMGLDRVVLRILAGTLESCPPGAFLISKPAAEAVSGLGAAMFGTGLRLAFPVLALLVMVDLALAMVGRIQPSLQLLNLAFPVKMLAALAVLAWTATLAPKLLESTAAAMFSTLMRALKI